MNPRQYLEEIVESNVADLVAEPTLVRRAWIATISLFHIEDYLAGARKLKAKSSLRSELDLEFPQFAIVRDTANANKHFELDRGPRRGLSSRNLTIGKSAAFSDGSYFSDGTSFAERDDVARIEYGSELVDVVHLCTTCLEYLRTKVV